MRLPQQATRGIITFHRAGDTLDTLAGINRSYGLEPGLPSKNTCTSTPRIRKSHPATIGFGRAIFRSPTHGDASIELSMPDEKGGAHSLEQRLSLAASSPSPTPENISQPPLWARGLEETNVLCVVQTRILGRD